jgi:hypothetical protein
LVEGPDETHGHDETEIVHLGSALCWGGVIVRSDGSTVPMPEHEVLTAAIPQWVQLAEHLDDTVDICLDVVTRPESLVRVAAVSAFGAIARRYARLPQEQAVRLAVTRALHDPVDEVREAAAVARQAIEQALGT